MATIRLIGDLFIESMGSVFHSNNLCLVSAP